METIAICMQKGGVGKTLTAHQIGAGLILKGYRVLFVDLDPQQNLSYSMGANMKGATIASLFEQAIDPDENSFGTLEAIQHTKQGDLLAGSPSIAGADTILADEERREYILKDILRPARKNYDYCIIDTPPTLGTLTVNALTAADIVIAPAQAEVFSLMSIGQLYNTITTVRKHSNKALSFKGILLTRYNNRTVLSRDMADKITAAARQCGTRVFNTRIRECTALKEAALVQQNIFQYAPRSNAAADYKAFIEELLQS